MESGKNKNVPREARRIDVFQLRKREADRFNGSQRKRDARRFSSSQRKHEKCTEDCGEIGNSIESEDVSFNAVLLCLKVEGD